MKAGQNKITSIILQRLQVLGRFGFITEKRKWRKELKGRMYHGKVGNENLNKHIGFW